MAWVVRLVKTGADGENHAVDVMAIDRPDDLSEIASLGLTLAEAKRLLACLQQKVVASRLLATPPDVRTAEAAGRFAM